MEAPEPSQSDSASEPDGETPLLAGGYVMVEHEDVVAAVAAFIAHFVAAHPQATHMAPEALQAAVVGALRQSGKKTRIRRLLGAGRCIYRWAVWSSGILHVYESPWVVRAASMALWASIRLVLGHVM